MRIVALACLILVATPCFAAQTKAPAKGGIPGVVAGGVEPELVSENFLNTEGPLGAADGTLYFSDTDASRTYHLDADGKITIFGVGTNRGNGIEFDRQGAMLWAEGDSGRILKQDMQKGGYTNLTQGTRLFQPNDLIVDAKGGVYFTDPGPRPVVPGLKVTSTVPSEFNRTNPL